MKAKRFNINLSKILKQRLIELLREKTHQKWQDENQEAINSYNKSIEECGVFSDGIRRF